MGVTWPMIQKDKNSAKFINSSLQVNCGIAESIEYLGAENLGRVYTSPQVLLNISPLELRRD